MLVQDRVLLLDSDSKFGTFVLMKGLRCVDSELNKLPIQIEKKCFFFHIRDRFTMVQRMINCCRNSAASVPNALSKDGDHFSQYYFTYPSSALEELDPVEY
jgi:hypothetical protein